MTVKATPSSDLLYLGKGLFLFNRFDASNNPTTWRHLGNVDSAELSSNNTKVQKFSAMQASAPLYKEVITKRIATLALKLNEFHPENLALFGQGQVNYLSQVATAVVGEAVAATTVPGSYFTTAKLGPISAVAVKFAATPGVLGTDYEITNAKVGLIHILATTALTGAVTIDYTPTAYATTVVPIVAGGYSGRIEGALKFVGDPTAGPAQVIDFWHCLVSPDGSLQMIADDFGDLGLSLEVFDDSVNHPSAPIFQSVYLP